MAPKPAPIRRSSSRPVVKPDLMVEQQEVEKPKSARPSTREGKVNLSFWIDEDLRNQLTIIWAKKGIRRTQDGMAEMVVSYLEAHGQG
jgi:hypothetical protein